jgi:hypothetical protein
MKPYYIACLLLGTALLNTGCSQKNKDNPIIESERNLKPESAHRLGSPATAAPHKGLTFAPPESWISEPPASSNRKAQFKLPHAEGDTEDAKLVVYFFQGGGGTPQANVNRWIGEFSGPDGSPVANSAKVTHRTINGIPLTVVDVSGSYANSMMSMQQTNGPKPNYRLIGAIAETKDGPWFIKLTGPAKTVSKWASSYEAFLNSIREK